MIDRRAFTAAALATSATPAFAQPRRRPLVIAHRGASGERPEHTLSAYRLAIAQGADFIEPDLVPTKDGHLVARHENEIGGTTDIGQRPEFASRKTTKIVDGESVTGWFTEDFTLAELKTLRARERLPQLRPGSAAFDGGDTIPTLQEVLDLARRSKVGVYPEMKHPAYFSALGLALEPRLLAGLRRSGLNAASAPVFVQCFEVEPLKTFKALGGRCRRVMLVAKGAAPVDVRTANGLRAVAAFAEGLGPEWPLVIPSEDGGLGEPTPLVAQAHAVGLAVHPWTVRAENAFLPRSLQRGDGPAAHGDAAALCRALYAAGVDGVFSDFPALAVAARAGA